MTDVKIGNLAPIFATILKALIYLLLSLSPLAIDIFVLKKILATLQLNEAIYMAI